MCSCFSTGGGVPHLARRDGSEVRVVISCQRQGQIYLCDTANLGPSAHRWHPDSESCSGNFLDKLENWAYITHFRTGEHLSFTEEKKKEQYKIMPRLFIWISKGKKTLKKKTASIWAIRLQGFPPDSFSLFHVENISQKPLRIRLSVIHFVEWRPFPSPNCT